MESSILWFSFNRSKVTMAVNSLKVMHYLTVNMSQKILFHPADSQYKKKEKYFVLFRYNSELTTHAYTHSQVHTCRLTYTKKETMFFFTVNNAMCPWHNQKDSAKATA